MGRDVNELNINRSSIARARQWHRTCLVSGLKSSVKDDLKNVSLTVHWDGKLLPDLTGNKKVDRLPILVSGSEVIQLLSVPKLLNGSGEAMAAAVYAAITDWDIQEQVCAMAFDTTSSNTGLKSGACTLLEGKIGKRLLSFACRHHMFEIVLEHVFSLTLPAASTGPDVQIFKRFQGQWAFIDQTTLRTGLEDAVVRLKITEGIKEEVLAFSQQQLEEVHPRDDYKEPLQLTVISLGGVPAGGIRVPQPVFIEHGGCHACSMDSSCSCLVEQLENMEHFES